MLFVKLKELLVMLMNFEEKTTKILFDVREELKVTGTKLHDMGTKLDGLRELLLEVSNIEN